MEAHSAARRVRRDAERSRESILEAAEQHFAQHGFAGASLADIAATAGLARATPSYFFGSKERLYRAVLERVMAAREDALRAAFAPLRHWAAGEPGAPAALGDGIAAAVDGYLAFLDDRPAFARLVEWEALADGEGLRGVAGHSTAISEAFTAVRAVAGERGLRAFDPTLVVVAFVSLCFLPVAHEATFSSSGGIATSAPSFRAAYKAQVCELVLGLLVARY